MGQSIVTEKVIGRVRLDLEVIDMLLASQKRMRTTKAQELIVIKQFKLDPKKVQKKTYLNEAFWKI
jgi:hypothetical protein